jgi:hypothetical protein
MRTLIGLAIGISLLVSQASAARRAHRMVRGPEAGARVEHLLTELKWETSLEDAKQRAAAEGKLVFWVQMLGRIDGST